MKIPRRPSKKWIMIISLVIIASFLTVMWFMFETALAPIVPFKIASADNAIKAKATKKKPDDTAPKTVAKPSAQQPSLTTKYSTTDPASIWVVINKSHPLSPVTYEPTDLVTTNGATISAKAEADFNAMILDAKTIGITLSVVSSYRSYYTQQSLYNNYVSIYGQAATDTFSARPGYSEHQTGLAVDFGSNTQTACNLDTCFDQTPEGKWLAANAYRFGFLLRYTAAKQGLTGYKDEPWHYRFVGRELTADMKKKNIITLEEYFNISGGTVYV